MPIAIEVFDAQDARLRIDVNGMPWAVVARGDLPEILAQLGQAYVQGELARLLSESGDVSP